MSVIWKVFARCLAAVWPLARIVIPQALRRRLTGGVRVIERFSRQAMVEAFQEREAPLSAVGPLTPSMAFNGPVVLVNNALAWGGVERQIVYTLQGLQKRSRCPLALLCLRLGSGAEYDFYRGALDSFDGIIRNVIDRRISESLLSERLTTTQRKAIEGSIRWLPADVRGEIWRFLAEFLVLRPRVVHAWQDAISISAGFAAHIAGVPRVILSGRNVAPIHFNFHREYMKLAYQELSACSNVLFVNNSMAGARSYSKWLDIEEERFVVVRNGIDAEEIKRPDKHDVVLLRKQIGIPDEVRVVGSIFRFYPEKRPFLWADVAARVVARHPNVHFVVFGAGPLRDAMWQKASALGLNGRLHLPGTIKQSATGLGLFDVFLLTSEFEGTPNVVLEASLLGIPAVVTEAGGAAEALQEGVTGYVVDADADQIADRVCACLADGEIRRRAAEMGPRFILERFSLERMVDETLKLYRGACV